MRKIVKILIPILIVSFILSPTLTRSDYQVIVGSSYTYNVNNAYIEATKGTNSASGNGYQLDYQPFNEGTSVVVEVTAVNPAVSVNWDISTGGETESGSSSIIGDLIGISFFIIYPIIVFDSFGNMPWSTLLSSVEIGTGLIILPFWDITAFTIFENMANETQIASLTTEPDFQDLQFQGNYQEVGGNMILDWYLLGSIDVTATYSIVFDVEHQWKIVYDLSTGVLRGMRMTSTATGTHTGVELDIYMDYHIELQGFNLDDYEFGPGTPVPGFGWVVTGIALGVLAIPIIIRKLRN
jgi:hypothetical protein